MLEIIREIVMMAMILIAIFIVMERKSIRAIMELALFSLMFVSALFLLKAPDVALSAIVVGAILVGLFLYTIQEVEGLEDIW
ncbi:MAG: hydrogenase subunit MbhD domain-containing protein [Candidatus Thermoplasmatota archaeon]